MKAQGNQRNSTMRFIEDMVSMFIRRSLLKSSRQYMELNPDIQRGLSADIPSYIIVNSLRKQEDVDPDIHRRLIVDAPSQISSEN